VRCNNHIDNYFLNKKIYPVSLTLSVPGFLRFYAKLSRRLLTKKPKTLFLQLLNSLLLKVLQLLFDANQVGIKELLAQLIQLKSDWPMKHLNPYRFYELAAKLHGLFNNLNQNRVADMFGPLTEAQTTLDSLIKGDPIPLETSKSAATRLLNKISSVFNRYFIDQSSRQLKTPTGEDRIDPHEIALIQALVDKFEHALAAELNHAPTYVAGKRGIYSTYDLIENAYETFPPALLEIIPETAQREFGTAGRALAFGLGTAAVTHLLRAIEVVLKQYYELYSGTTVAKTERTYAIYLKKLATLSEDENTSSRPDKRLLQMLAQIKEHYRNPLTAPESAFTVDQATSLFGLGTAAITLMTEQIQAKQKPKTGKEAKAAKGAASQVGDDNDDDSYNFGLAQTG